MSNSSDEAKGREGAVLGLSSADVAQRVAEGKVNVNTELKTKSVRELVVENVCTLFNLINLVLAIMVIITGTWKNLTFLGIVILNTGIGIVQSLRSKRLVDKLTLLATKKATVLRDGGERQIDLEEIVLDDVIRLGRGDQIPADAVVVSGEGHVNESLLTGESNPIHKHPGDELMSGSFIDAGLILARVIHVGADNYVARINNEAKYVKKVNSEIMDALNAIVRFASVIMLPLGIALLCTGVYDAAMSAGIDPDGLIAWLFTGEGFSALSSSILATVSALLGMIPQGLVLLTSSVLAIATIRLARRRVLAQQLYCIETLARVDVLCLDKTGTITSGHMEVEGVYIACDGKVSKMDGARGRAAGPSSLPPHDPEQVLANIARATAADANETCTAILKRYEDPGFEIWEPVGVVPFNSAKKWSGAAFASGSYIMGAAQFVLSPKTLEAYREDIDRLASSCRVLVIAQVEGFTEEGDFTGAPVPLGFVAIRDEIRASAAETIGYFREQGVRLNVISGDDPRTVSTIARAVGIPDADKFVDATTLDTPAKLDSAAGRFHVFGRVTPQQKRDLVKALQRRGHTVAMTGDGVNDVLALKEADCSVAMAAGSDAARNVAEIVLVDNDFASMPAVVAEGRRSINNLQRSASLFLTKTLFSMGLAAICIFWPPYPFQPITMSLENFFCIGLPSFVLALEANRARVEGRFLNNVLKRAVPAAAGVLLGCVLSMIARAVGDLSVDQLSTLCLASAASVGLALIWRISQPLTVLRGILFGFVAVGLVGASILMPRFFSIAPVWESPVIAGVLISAASVLVFLRLAVMLETAPRKTARLASGFGRGISVSRGGRRVRARSSWLLRQLQRLLSARRGSNADSSAAGGSTASRAPQPSRRARLFKSKRGIHVNMNDRPGKRKS